MRIAFMSWRDLANDLAGGSEVFIDRLAVGMMDLGHEVTLLCGGPVGERPYPVVDLGGTHSQYLRAPFIHHRTVRDWDLLVDTENGIPYFSPLWRRKPVLAFVHHVHTDQWGQHFGPVLAGVGRIAEEVAMPRVYRRVPFLAISPSTATRSSRSASRRDRISILNPGVDLPAVDGVDAVGGAPVRLRRATGAAQAGRPPAPRLGAGASGHRGETRGDR